MQMNFNRRKSGVSLIVVLMFMMIATIAATATWKWITSEGKSSSSRMIKREAYQSAMGGIENARAWMTYHANDVGAIIRQYIDGGKKPINLDSRLRSLQRAGQNYHVWLTGVNVEGATYKLKLFSSGEARGNAKHNEVAILNVDGLYRVNLPKEQSAKSNDFDYNYFGGTTLNHGDIFVRSILVNGDLIGGNPATVDSNLVVTGNFKVSGNSIAVHGTACVGGDLDADNGLVGNNFYVNGDLKNLKIRALTAKKKGQTINLGNSIYGNLYVNGNITSANGDQVVDGNMTLNGRWTTNMSGYNAGVRGDFCVGSNGQVYFSNLDREFRATGNVWMESDYPIWVEPATSWGWWFYEVDNYSKYNRINLGSPKKNVYVKTGHPWEDYKTLRENTYKFNELKDKPFGCKDDKCDDPERKWTDKKDVKVFVDKAKKPNLYYLYNYSTGLVQYESNNYMDAYWNNKYLTVYKVDGKRFWDTYNTVNTFNYSGHKANGSPFCYQSGNGVGPEQFRSNARPTCGVTPWFKVDGDFKTPFPDSRPENLTCAESAKAHCDSIWEKTDGCGTAKYLVSDPLKTGISFFENYANNNNCVRHLVNNVDYNNFDFSQFNTCYNQALEHDQNSDTKYLYNKYLVVKITNRNIFTSSKGLLTGKFIFIFENDLHQNMKIPATYGNDSYLFMYFKDGLSGEVLPADNVQELNFFIYTKNDINNVLFNQTLMKGSIYAAVRDEATGAKTCAKVNNLTFNGGMEFNQEMVDDLTNSGVLCKNDGSACGGIFDGTVTDDDDEETGEAAEKGKDRYFISTAPQLGINVESVYETRESQPNANDTQELQSSYLILPRVIYLPSDPYGELKDYYNVMALNGSAVKKEDVVYSVSCSGPGSISTTGKLFTGTTLTRGIYKCEASPSGYDQMSFWVVVGSASRGDGEVSFEKPYQSMGATQSAEVNILVSPHSTDLKIKVNCPALPSSEWSYTKNTELLDNTALDGCTFKILPNNQSSVYKLFDVYTTNATSGRLTFTLKPGEGYTLASPYYTDLVVSSTADINRADLSSSEIESYCESHSGYCPTTNYYSWPNCSYNGLWVEPEGGATAIVPNEINQSWSVSIGGSAGTIELKDRSGGKCVVIIPDGSDNKLQKSSMEAGVTYTLKATAKAVARTLKVVFLGDVGSGNTPVVKYSTQSTNDECTYTGVGIGNACSIPVYEGEDISLSLDSSNVNNKEFSYWQCSGTHCPSTDPFHTWIYDSFKVNDNETVMYVHFGESDKHCFDEVFKNNNVACTSDDVEYCVDKCDVADDAVCVGAVDSRGTFAKAKWHLLSGQLSDIEQSGGAISIKNVRKKTRGVNNKKSKIKVISTVTAGINGTLKALFRMPMATSSYGRSSENITNSGFMLRSDVSGTEYLMLNVFVNTKGRLEAQVCTDAGSCLNGELARNGSTKSVTTASMVMMSATLNTQNQLVISAFTGSNYYGTPDEYSYTFNLNSLTTSYSNRAHEYVGFSLADPNFKLYGIGWESEDYSSECWDTPPSVKCSFAAKAQNGVIELDKEVVPWVGHSGWFNSKSCTPRYFYYNGNDAGCGSAGEDGLECFMNYYKFAASGEGLHGYGNDVKTAKASLTCTSTDGVEDMWNLSAGRAHCGIFWTGNFTECTSNQAAMLENVTLEALDTNLTERVFAQGSRYNLRGATINVTLENPGNSEVELVLVSKHDFNSDYAGFNAQTAWGDYKGNTIWGSTDDGEGYFLSRPVKIKGNRASFDVVEDLAKGAEGFDPEKVRSIILKNHGTSSVTIKDVSASCKNAVSVSSCKAEYKEDNVNAWVVTAFVNNIASATSLTLNKKVGAGAGENYKCGEKDIDCVKQGEEVTYTIADNPYIHQGEHYYFKMSASNGSVTDTKDCSVSPDPIGSISSECSVNPQSVQTGKGMPQFQFTLYGCPKSGCKYEIQLGDQKEKGTAPSGSQVKRTFSNLNTEANALQEGEYTYRVVKDGEDTPFSDCSATFNVTKQMSQDEKVATTCNIESMNNGSLTAGSQAKFNFVVNNNQGINISGRNYQLEFPDGNIVTGNTGANQTQTVWFNVPAESGNVTLRVWDQNGYKESCTSTLAVGAPTVTCGVSKHSWDISGENTFYASENLYFMAKNNASVGGTFNVSILKNGAADGSGTISSYSNWSNLKNIGNLDAGEYTYKVQFNGADICSHSITVVSPLNCTVSKTSLGFGESFTLTTAYSGSCWNSSLSGSPANGNGLSWMPECQTSYTITPSNAGTFEYTYSVTNGSVGTASCSKTVVVGDVAPKIVCPDDKTAKVGSTVTVVPKSVTGCGAGCSYTIEGAGASEASGYTGGPVSFTGSSTAGKKDYKFHVTNTKGTDKCDFSITYTENASSCNCTCSSGCDNLYSGASVEGPQSSKHCLFAASITEINENFDRHTILVNGERPGYCSNGDNSNLCTSKFASFDKIDGGYYIETPITSGDNAWFKVAVEGSRTPDCEGGSSGGGSSSGGSTADYDIDLTNTGNDTGGPLNDGKSYEVKDIGNCSYVRFNCRIWEETNGCSIAVNSNSPIWGGHNSNNNIVSPKPSIGDILHVTGTVTQIWCANW